jgi:heme A synthase
VTGAVVALFVFAGVLAAASLVTRVTYLRRHPPSPVSKTRSRLLIALVSGSAATGIAIGFATSDRPATVGHVVSAFVLLAIITLYAWWRFTPSRGKRERP